MVPTLRRMGFRRLVRHAQHAKKPNESNGGEDVGAEASNKSHRGENCGENSECGEHVEEE